MDDSKRGAVGGSSSETQAATEIETKTKAAAVKRRVIVTATSPLTGIWRGRGSWPIPGSLGMPPIARRCTASLGAPRSWPA